MEGDVMEEPKRHEPSKVIPPPRLEYRDGATDRLPVNKSDLTVGIVVSFAIMTETLLLAPALGMSKFFLVAGATTILCNGWACLAYRNPTGRWLGIGLWIGFGVAVAIEGSCFGLARFWR